MRFGISEYEGVSENDEKPSTQHVRSYFLQTVSSMAPEVSEGLERELLPLYRQIPLFCFEADTKRRRRRARYARWVWRDHNRPSWSVIENAWLNRNADEPFEVEFSDYYDEPDKSSPGSWFVHFFKVPKHNDPRIAVFVAKLFDWSRRHNLDEVWCRSHAYETLDLWSVEESYRKKRVWRWLPNFHPITIVPDEPAEFIFKYPTLYPSDEVREDLERKITSDFNAKLKTFLDRREAAAIKAGMTLTPQKRERDHFKWLVMYQVMNKSQQDISNQVNATRSTVADGIKAAASMCELRLRSPKPAGRPKKI